MTANDIQAILKQGLGEFLGKEANSSIWSTSQAVMSAVNKEIRVRVKKKEDELQQAVKTPLKDAVPRSAKIQEYMDNPMTPEDESKALRAILHAGLAKGDIPPQLLDKLDKIIGVNSGKDDKIEVVDFATAFPDLAKSVVVCMKMLENETEA